MGAPDETKGAIVAVKQIRTMHPDGFRSGSWAILLEKVEHEGRDCFYVEFPIDGRRDHWPVDDPQSRYEFRGTAAA